MKDGKQHQIALHKVDRRFYPPVPERNSNTNDIIVVEVSPAYITHVINYVSNKMTEEYNAAYEQKQRERQQILMEERERKQQELAQMRRHVKGYDSDISSLEKFARGDYATCPVCFRPPRSVSCGCQNPTSFSAVGAMNGASKLLKENKELKKEVATLKQQLEQELKTKMI
jgi:uncharacterized protein YlxW (UPF0749 family)